jgi:hypothetical protein
MDGRRCPGRTGGRVVSSSTFTNVKQSIRSGAVHVSVHARDEAAADDLLLEDIEAATLLADCTLSGDSMSRAFGLY